jgi:hypothetical protein
MVRRPSLEYHCLAAERLRSVDTWEMFVADLLLQPWLEQYAIRRPDWRRPRGCGVGPLARTRGTTGHVAPDWVHPGTGQLV